MSGCGGTPGNNRTQPLPRFLHPMAAGASVRVRAVKMGVCRHCPSPVSPLRLRGAPRRSAACYRCRSRAPSGRLAAPARGASDVRATLCAKKYVSLNEREHGGSHAVPMGRGARIPPGTFLLSFLNHHGPRSGILTASGRPGAHESKIHLVAADMTPWHCRQHRH